MIRTCPGCNGFHIRRSSNPEAGAKWRRALLSPYRCSDCRTRFWKISRKAYVVAAAAMATITVWVIVWYVIGLMLTTEFTPMAGPSRF